MRIVVCVKPVPVVLALDLTTGRLLRDGPFTLNPLDEHAVEAALQIRDTCAGSEVILLAVADDDASEALRPGLAMGADRAVVVSGQELCGSDLLGTSAVLAAAAQSLGPDLVLFGASSSDGNGAMLWAAVAERLRLPVVSRAVEVSVQESVLTATRQMEDGMDVVQTELPAVLALSGEVATPRYPTFRDVVAAKRKTISLLGIADLGIDPATVGQAGARTTVLDIAEPQRRGDGVIVEDDGLAAEQLVQFLLQRGLV